VTLADDPAVLLVDDRPENLLALRATLEPLKCRTVAVTSGDEALKALLQQEFAVVLLDVQMPGLDGFETAEMIKSRARTRAVPIIFVTAISKERHHVFRGYSAGAVDYLFKPYDPELLRSKVRVFIQLAEASRAAARSEAMVRAAFESAPIGMARIDAEGRFAEVNRALARLLGSTPAQLRDRLFESVVHPEDDPGAEHRARLLEGALEHDEREARLTTADGPVPCRLTFSVARVPGLPPALILQVQDLRAQRTAELEREQRIREQVARTEAERTSATLRALQTISDAAISHREYDGLVHDLLDRTADALAVDTAAFVLLQPGGTYVVHQIAATDSAGADRRWYSVVAGDPQPADGGEPPSLSARMAASISSPLVVAGETLGRLHVGSLFARRFTQGEQDLLRLAADRAALAIQRAALHRRDLAITEELQRSLLPARLPDVPGMATAARYLPGGQGERVGGDWYDAVLQSPDQLLLIIGDVAGHGIAAAADMGQLRSALLAYALDGHGPGAILERLNAFQIGVHGPGMSTVALVRFDRKTRKATYSCAGHLPPLLLRPDGETVWLDGALAPPIGAVPDQAYREQSIPVRAGSALVLYTDGLVEERGERVDIGLERLRDAVRDAPGEAEAVCDRILESLPIGEADDDVTLLVLRTAAERRRRASDRRSPNGADAAESESPDPVARQLAHGTWRYHAARSARVELPRTPLAAGAARRIVTEMLAGWISDAELRDLYTIISEVVNNAVVHGDGEAQLVVQLAAAAEALRVEVTNDGAAFTPAEPSTPDEPGGFGMVIIDRMASRWGIDFTPGVCVWFELDRGRAP
jgi:PAS domain S-box-containing protein